MSTSFRIKEGWDEIPISLDQLSPPLFSIYSGIDTIRTEWHDYVSREMDGNRDWVEIGLPWVRAYLFRLSRAEFAYLMTLEGEVSIRTLNQTGNDYQIFNGKLKRPEANGESANWSGDAIGGWTDVILDIMDLEPQ